jgi:hypothetical protein
VCVARQSTPSRHADERRLTVHEAIVHDGPLRGRWIGARYPGFLLADKPRCLAWVYRLTDSGWSVVADDDGTFERALDDSKAITAALGDQYDVIAHPGGD